jgi:hypothetical protein
MRRWGDSVLRNNGYLRPQTEHSARNKWVLVLICSVITVRCEVDVHSATFTAASCNSAAIQTALNSAAGGDTVVIPNGACTWTTGLTISGKGIFLIGQSQAGVVITNNATWGIAVVEDATRHIDISSMTVSGSGTFIQLNPHSTPNDDGKAVLIHDIVFHDTTGIRANVNRGVIYSNLITGLNSLNANLEFVQCTPEELTTSWTTPSTMGMNDLSGESNLYIEDNRFVKVLQAGIDVDANSRVVIRRNTFDNSAIGSHGVDTGLMGVRHFELYDNTFIFTNFGECDGSKTASIPFFWFLRGGTGIIADNTGFKDMSSCAWGNKPALDMTVMNLQRDAGPNPCWGAGTSNGAKYPAPRQIGLGYVTGTGKDGLGRSSYSLSAWGWPGAFYVGDLEPLYIWNQPGMTPAVSDYGLNNAGTSCSGSTYDTTANYLKAGRDYILNTPKPGYVKYTYPHPLRGGAVVTPPPSACDVNSDGTTNVSDVQLIVNQAIGVATCSADINKDGSCNVIDVQRVVNAALGGQCVTQ